MYGKQFKADSLGLKDMLGQEIHEGDIIVIGGGYKSLNNEMEIVQYEWGGFYPFAIPGWEDVTDPSSVIVVGSAYNSTFESIKERVKKTLIRNAGPPIRSFYMSTLFKRLNNVLSNCDGIKFKEDGHSHSYIQLIEKNKEGK